MPVGELLSRISAAELTEWIAYEQVAGPLGGIRDDLHAGIVASTIANVNRGKGKRAFKPREFMPEWDRPRANTPQAMANYMKQITLGLGGKILRRDRKE